MKRIKKRQTSYFKPCPKFVPLSPQPGDHCRSALFRIPEAHIYEKLGNIWFTVSYYLFTSSSFIQLY